VTSASAMERVDMRPPGGMSEWTGRRQARGARVSDRLSAGPVGHQPQAAWPPAGTTTQSPSPLPSRTTARPTSTAGRWPSASNGSGIGATAGGSCQEVGPPSTLRSTRSAPPWQRRDPAKLAGPQRPFLPRTRGSFTTQILAPLLSRDSDTPATTPPRRSDHARGVAT
jgi:hypothetical protein